MSQTNLNITGTIVKLDSGDGTGRIPTSKLQYRRVQGSLTRGAMQLFRRSESRNVRESKLISL
jgi:hypothetical protein